MLLVRGKTDIHSQASFSHFSKKICLNRHETGIMTKRALVASASLPVRWLRARAYRPPHPVRELHQRRVCHNVPCGWENTRTVSHAAIVTSVRAIERTKHAPVVRSAPMRRGRWRAGTARCPLRWRGGRGGLSLFCALEFASPAVTSALALDGHGIHKGIDVVWIAHLGQLHVPQLPPVCIRHAPRLSTQIVHVHID